MSLRRSLVVAACAATLFACLGRLNTEESDAGADSGSGSGGDGAPESSSTTCPAPQSFFNGACRIECASSTMCPSGTTCFQVEAGTSLCLPYQSCSYLGSDTQCVGTGTYVTYDRGVEETFTYGSDPANADPYDVTPYLDPYFEPDTTQGQDTVANGCEGDATFVKVTATGEVACGQAHDVVRCRRLDYSCVLVPGTTTDFVSP